MLPIDQMSKLSLREGTIPTQGHADDEPNPIAFLAQLVMARDEVAR